MRNIVFTPNENVRDTDGTLMVSLLIRRTIRQGTVTVDTNATKIPTSPLSKRLSIVIINISSNVVYLGNSAVTTSDGYPLYPRQSIGLQIEDEIDIYGIAGGSSEVRLIEGG